MSESNILQRVHALQFTDKAAAEALLLPFVRETFPALDVTALELRPLAVSLNSFNGFLTLMDGTRLFFKTHTEPDNVIGEYYRADLLASAGYPVVQPRYRSTEAGKQLLIYDVIDAPSVFDLAWQIENGDLTRMRDLTEAQEDANMALFNLYMKSLASQSAEEAASAPIHQLFFHRLTGGRLDRFYDYSRSMLLPDGQISLREVRGARWTINGQRYEKSLDDLIADAIRLLNPAQPGPSVIGHGDAHNGNVFLTETTEPVLLQDGTPFDWTRPSLLYFDPAFAGRHHPLLDIAKPMFHNVFAMWMYFPHEMDARSTVTLERSGAVWTVTYRCPLPPVRYMFLHSLIGNVLELLAQSLKGRDMLREDWRAYLKAALFCCPLLTMDLTDSSRFPPSISLLGLAMAVEMGAESSGQRSLLDQTLDQVEAALAWDDANPGAMDDEPPSTPEP